MPHYRVRDAARFLAVSEDTVRRWIDSGALPADRDDSGRFSVDGVALAAFARESAVPGLPDTSGIGRSARNRFVGIVSRVEISGVMAQVEIQCGPHTVVSLISSDAVRELDLEPGKPAIAVVKATNVIVETPEGTS